MGSEKTILDVFVVGGGINGAGIAAEASKRGLSVALCEKSDLASATSSASSKLIHGGLRYLEHYEFRLVREALAEREVLLQAAPHLIKPLRFVLPHRSHLRPAWMIRTGLFMYDHLSKRNHLPGSASKQFSPEETANPLQDTIKKGFEYSDCQVDDARLVITNALAANQNGAQIHTRTECISAKSVDGIWQIELRNNATGAKLHYQAKTLVNAAGPWAQSFVENTLELKSPQSIRLIKGSHFVTKKLYEGDQAYILQNEDKRIVFVIPYQQDFTLIGTTDKEYEGDPANVAMDQEEEKYLLDVVNRHFKQTISSDHILWRYSGVRPLCNDESDSPSAITRDYTLELQNQEGETAPLLSIFGGKITTYRKLALAALDKLTPFLPEQSEATSAVHIPGGDMGGQSFDQWLATVEQRYPWLPESLLQRLSNAYGTRIHELLQNCQNLSALGTHFGAGLYQREVDYLCQHEWAHCAEDILWRRSKLGLHLTPDQAGTLQFYLTNGLLQEAG